MTLFIPPTMLLNIESLIVLFHHPQRRLDLVSNNGPHHTVCSMVLFSPAMMTLLFAVSLHHMMRLSSPQIIRLSEVVQLISFSLPKSIQLARLLMILLFTPNPI